MGDENATIGLAGAHHIQRTSERRSAEQRHSLALAGVLFLTICGFTSCFSDKYELRGERKVDGSQNLLVKIYQKDEFEHLTPINFKLISFDDSILIPETYLTGTDVRHEKVERFYPFLYDSIFYLCYPYPQVYVIKHLCARESRFPRDSLFEKLKAHDNTLIDMKE